jgi:putative peptidoglycan lipid II flippase
MSTRGMIRSTLGASSLTLVSRLLGLIRDKALVVVLGPMPWVLDAFLLAFTIPNLFRRLFGEGALSSAFIPVFIEYREERPAAEAARFASAVLTALAAVLTGVVLVGALVAWLAADALAAAPADALALRLTAAMLPFTLFICVAALLAGMLQSLQRFALPAAMPVLLNVAFLAALGWLAWERPDLPLPRAAYWVAGAVVLAALAQVVVQALALAGRGMVLRPVLCWDHPGLRRVLQGMGPTAVGLAVFQINVLADRLIAYLLVPESGALTHLYLGNRLMQLPLGLFGVSMATVAFPALVSHLQRQEWETLFVKLSTAMRFLLFVMLPSAVGLAVLASPIVRMIFYEADETSFDRGDVYRTGLVLALYAPGLFFIAVQQLLTRAHYARGDYRTPVRITAGMVGLNLVLNLALIHAPDLYRRWALGESAPLGEGGLALSTSLCAALTAWLLWDRLRAALRDGEAAPAWDQAFGTLRAAAVRIGLAAGGMGLLCYWVARSIPTEPELAMRLERGLVSVGLGVVFYLVLCYVIPVPEVEEFLFRRRRRG